MQHFAGLSQRHAGQHVSSAQRTAGMTRAQRSAEGAHAAWAHSWAWRPVLVALESPQLACQLRMNPHSASLCEVIAL